MAADAPPLPQPMAIDAAVDVSDYQSVLRFWFEGSQTELYRSKWFPPDGSDKQRRMDTEITETFGAMLQRAESGKLDAWKASRDGFVALVVLLDQFSRHVYRQQRDCVDRNDALALTLTHELVARGWHTALPVPQFVFVMMPLRHTPTSDSLHEVLATIDERKHLQDAHNELLEKFRKTTQNRLAHLRGDVVAQSDDDILERPFVATDETSMPTHRLYRAMHEYLQRQRARAFSHMAVSLSGGVDSMVIAHLLHKLRGAHGDYTVVAVHLDYGNRSESGAECDYVRRWCERFGIVFHARRIDEVQRATTKRDDYERVSREIRYATYAQIMAQYGAPGMCFGHHRGDVQENVISNMMKGLSLLNLNGMSESSVVNGVRIWRPLLAFDKDAILDFAHRYGVPYFKDTTPAWSTRGKMRTHLMPLLRDMYGDGVLANLSTLGAESTQCGEVIDQKILTPMLRGIRTSDAAVWLDCIPLKAQPFFVWKEVVRTLCHSFMGNAMVRDKPLRELIAKLARHEGDATGDQWITLKKGNRAILTAQQTLIVFRDRLFPKQLSFTFGTPLVLGETYVFGPWTVKTSLFDEEGHPLVEQWRRGDVLTLRPFVETARIEYALPRATSLVLSSEERPPTLRMREKALTDHIPLVVTRGDAVGENEFVHVTLVYCNGPGTH